MRKLRIVSYAHIVDAERMQIYGHTAFHFALALTPIRAKLDLQSNVLLLPESKREYFASLGF